MVKCLSIKQPYAWLIMAGYKDVENRTWRTHYRGPLLVHAGLTFAKNVAFGGESGIFLPPDFFGFARGAVIGRVDLIDCVMGHQSRWAATGCYHWVMSQPVLFDSPIPYKGRLGLFEVPDEIAQGESV